MAWSSSDAMKAIISKNFMTIVLFVLAIRLSFALFPSFIIDMNNWIAWSRILAEFGIQRFYSLPAWTDYTPGFLYYLWILGALDEILHFGASLYPFLIKLPIIFADILAGSLIYSLLEKKWKRWAIFGFLAYVFHPGLAFSDSIFGQTDGLLAFILLLAAYFIAEKNNPAFGWVCWGIAILIKPQALAVAPVFLIYCLKNFPIKKVALGLTAGAVAIVLIGYPFFHSDPIFGLPHLMVKMNNESTFTSFMAFNFWAWIPGMFIQDSVTFLGLSYYHWGTLLWITAVVLVALRYLRGKSNKISFYLAAGLSSLAFFIFVTRLHERYILYAFPLLLLAALLAKSKTQIAIYFFMGFLSLVNIYYPYAYYTKDSFLSSQGLVALINNLIPWISISYLASFLFLLVNKKISLIENFHLRLGHIGTLSNKIEEIRENKVVASYWKLILFGILAFAFVSRVWNLGFPKTYYFDEVYHAFTAEAYARNDPKGYEWWNPPPEGFAYEWLHPPLAKLIQAGSIKIFGDRSFAWRFPGVLFACGTIFVLFLFGRSLFKSISAGLIAAFLYAIDGLSFVQSRITMNDIYLVFFLTLAFYLFWKYLQLLQSGRESLKRLMILGLVLGLACATKWTGVYGVGIIGLIWYLHLLILKRNKTTGSLLKSFFLGVLCFGVIPAAVYVSSYLQFWLQGHTIAQFKELHNQIWWYQTTLKATHPYQSITISWPILYRSIYYFADYSGNLVRNIYLLGNPLICWGGLLMTLGLTVTFFRRVLSNIKSIFFNPVLIVLAGYFGFFIPWAFSPRCMFLYHYLPSIPFLVLASAYVLCRFPKIITYYLILATVLFIYFYPHWTGIGVPDWLDKSYYWFPSWR